MYLNVCIGSMYLSKQVTVEGRVAAGIPRNLLKDCKMMSTNWQWNEHYNEIEGWKSDNGELEKESREREKIQRRIGV